MDSEGKSWALLPSVSFDGRAGQAKAGDGNAPAGMSLGGSLIVHPQRDGANRVRCPRLMTLDGTQNVVAVHELAAKAAALPVPHALGDSSPWAASRSARCSVMIDVA